MNTTRFKNSMRNSTSHYGWVSIVLHWLMATALIGLYFLGDYMVDLEYYDTWYHQAPALHKSIGVVIALLLVFRIAWNYGQKKPAPLENSKRLITAAKLGHAAIYALIFTMCVSGYLILTAKGKGINVFDLFELPAFLTENINRGELAGTVHDFVGTSFILIIMLHAIAALIHHFVFKDRTLKRMLWVKNSSEDI